MEVDANKDRYGKGSGRASRLPGARAWGRISAVLGEMVLGSGAPCLAQWSRVGVYALLGRGPAW